MRFTNISARENKVERWVARWANRQSVGYADGAEGALRDLCYGGCSSGIVRELIYTKDIERFYLNNARECEEIIELYEEEVGESLKDAINLKWPESRVWPTIEIIADKLAQEISNMKKEETCQTLF